MAARTGKTFRLEKHLEAALGKWCKANGYLWYKFTSPAKKSVPDRIAIGPKGKVGFIELKRKGGKPSTQQTVEIFRLVEQGANATWVDNYESAIEFLETLRS